jgi:hypothetical protein
MNEFTENEITNIYHTQKELILEFFRTDIEILKELKMNTENLERMVKEIEEDKLVRNRDRLGLIATTLTHLESLLDRTYILYKSLNYSPEADMLNLETYKKLYKDKKNITLKFLKYDLEITENFIKKEKMGNKAKQLQPPYIL